MLPLINRISNPSSEFALVLNIGHEILKFSPVINITATSSSICDFPACYVTCVSLETWRTKTITCTYLAKAATLKKIKHYQKMQANNMACSRISLNHTLRSQGNY